MTDLSRTATRGAGLALSTQGVRFGFQFASLVVLSRLLTPQDFGLVAMVTAIIGVAAILRDFGLSSASIQATELSDDERTNLFWANLGIGATCSVAILLSAPLIVLLFDQPAVRPIVFSLAWLFTVSGATTQFRAELSRSLRFKSLAINDIVSQGLGVGAAIAAALLGAGYWAIVIQQTVLILTSFVMNVLQCHWRPGWPKRKVSIKRFFRYGGGLMGMQTLGYVTNNVDNIAIGAYLGSDALGLYSRAYQLLIVPLNQISDALTKVVLPVLARVKDDPAVFDRYVKHAQLACCYLFGTSFAIAAGLAVPFTRIVLGPSWSGVAPIFAVLAVGGMFRGFSQVTYWIVLSRALTGSQFKVYLMMRPVMIALILLGLLWGPVGVAAGHSLAFMLDWLVSLWWVGRQGKFRLLPLLMPPLRSVLVVSAPAGLLAFLGTHLTSRPLLSASYGLAAAAIYIGLVLLFSPGERRDGRLVVVAVRKAVTRA